MTLEYRTLQRVTNAALDHSGLLDAGQFARLLGVNMTQCVRFPVNGYVKENNTIHFIIDEMNREAFERELYRCGFTVDGEPCSVERKVNDTR